MAYNTSYHVTPLLLTRELPQNTTASNTPRHHHTLTVITCRHLRLVG